MASHVLVYDGDCAFCRRSVERIRRWDTTGRLELVPFQDAGVMERFSWIPRPAFSEAMQLVGPSNETWAGAAAFEEVVRTLPRTRWLSFLFRMPFARRVADVVYRWIARNRRRFGCGDHCSVGTRRP